MTNFKDIFQQEKQLSKNVTAKVNLGTTTSAQLEAAFPNTNLTADITKDLLKGKSSKGISAETYLGKGVTGHAYTGSRGTSFGLHKQQRNRKTGINLNYGITKHKDGLGAFIGVSKPL
jgi:hypothetical protein